MQAVTSPSTQPAMESTSGSLQPKLDSADAPSSIPNVSESNQTNHNKVTAIFKRLWDGVLLLWNGILHLWGGIFHRRGGTAHQLVPEEEEEEDVVVYDGLAYISKKRSAWSKLLQTDFVDVTASIHDKAYDLWGHKVEIQLVSMDLDQGTKSPKLSDKASVKGWLTHRGDLDLVADNDQYKITFKVPTDFGEIGACVVLNNHPHEFYLQKLVLESPGQKSVVFNTLAWIHPKDKYPEDRVFFSSRKYITDETPEGLKKFRKQELEQNRGNGTGKREAWDRIYDYDVYNDYGNPDKDISLARPVLGGNKDLPYPRRNRTGRAMSKAVKSVFGEQSSFKNRKEIEQLYVDGLPRKKKSCFLYLDETPDVASKEGNIVGLSNFLSPKGENQSVLIYPRPDVVKHDMNAWETDEEFGRQTLAGLNPSVIQAVKEYPPKSTLDPSEYGEGTALTDDHILRYLEGLSVAEAISQKRLFTIDYRDALLPLVGLANADTKNNFKCYSPRAIFFFTKEKKMMPIAIELSLPPWEKGKKALNRVFTPADTENHMWGLAKIHFNAVDSNYHQVYSHFTETHAAIEPFIIATRRQISALHPIFPLLMPHFKDTMNINAAAREILIAGGGQIEENFNFGAQALRAGAVAYGAFWRFDHLNPARRLIARGLAEPADESHPGGVKLVIEDYPFAKDSLELWDALYNWVKSYVSIVYKGSDEAVKNDQEIQDWWDEIKNKGHGDKKDATWWPEMDSIESLADAIASMGYIAGPYHAAINFGQYAYGGYPLNKPTATRRFIPENDSAEYSELQEHPEAFLLSTITSPSMATTAMTVLEMLATHAVDEEYIGTESLASDHHANPKLAAAFNEFADAIGQVEKNIEARNHDEKLFNRHGPAQVPYRLLFPKSSSGLTGQGVPYSTSV